MNKTAKQFDQVVDSCKKVFQNKLEDYGSAWRIMRPESLTDQIFIKAKRIRSFETTGIHKVDENISGEYMAIINYAVISLIQLELGHSDDADLSKDEALKLFTAYTIRAKDLMLAKNHDYGEAWRNMRVSSYTDLILMKIHRTKQIEDNKGKTIMSEGIDANYFDMMNYAVFALIKEAEATKNQ